MNGSLTWRDIETFKAKATARDKALEFLKGVCDCEKLLIVEHILSNIPDGEGEA